MATIPEKVHKLNWCLVYKVTLESPSGKIYGIESIARNGLVNRITLCHLGSKMERYAVTMDEDVFDRLVDVEEETINL